MDPIPQGNTENASLDESVLTTGSHNITIRAGTISAGQIMLQAAEKARLEKRDPSRMLRVLALPPAPVYNPQNPDQPPTPWVYIRNGMYWPMV